MKPMSKTPKAVASSDRRLSQRYDTTLDVFVRFQPDGTPITGAANEVGPNGMRIVTMMPLLEGQYVSVEFQNASNRTSCEGRIVWTERKSDRSYESGIDIQRWGGGVPGHEFIHSLPSIAPKKDRRKKPR